jgi:hypothetical protein
MKPMIMMATTVGGRERRGVLLWGRGHQVFVRNSIKIHVRELAAFCRLRETQPEVANVLLANLKKLSTACHAIDAGGGKYFAQVFASDPLHAILEHLTPAVLGPSSQPAHDCTESRPAWRWLRFPGFAACKQRCDEGLRGKKSIKCS